MERKRKPAVRNPRKDEEEVKEEIDPADRESIPTSAKDQLVEFLKHLRAFFAKYGELEDGPVGHDKTTGKLRGFAIFVYKTQEGCKKALEEPSKYFDGCELNCQRAIEGMKSKCQATKISNLTTGLPSNDHFFNLHFTVSDGSQSGGRVSRAESDLGSGIVRA